MNLDKRILAILVVNILLLGNIGRYENIEFNKKIVEQDLTGESNIYSDMTSNPIEEPLKDNLITHLPNLAIESTGQILEDTDEFLAGSLSNLTIDSEGNLILDKSHIENWKDITTPGPSARRGHAMAYDSKLEKIILFGGEHGRNLFYDTWVYDLGTYTWTEIYTPEMFPDPRVDHAMVYSPVAEKVLLFGGVNEWGEVLDDMWVFDPNTNTWDFKPYNSFPTHIPARCGHSLVYDPFEEGIYLFGGYDYFDTYYQDCWFLEWDGGDLAEWYYYIPITDVPSPRAFHSMTCIYSTEDPMDRVAILFGGKNDEDTFEDTWVYDFYGRWILLTPSSFPSARFGHTMVYDSTTPQVILFGGYSAETYETFSDTWIFNLTTSSWNQKTPLDHPGGRNYHTMVYVPNSNLGFIFGGYDSSDNPDVYFSDTWIYIGTNYYETGSYLSQMTDYGHIYTIEGNVSWNPPNPPINTSLDIQIGFSNTTNDENFQFRSVNGPEDTFSCLAQYIRYQVRFKANLIQNSTPWLEWVNISYTLLWPTPFVELTNPLNNTQVGGTILISAEAKSPNGIANVSVVIDGVLQVVLFSNPYKFLWNSEIAENGGKTITAIATTILGKTNFHSIQVEVNNIVNTIPSPPQNLSAVAKQNNISLMWDPPLDNGGTSIIQYKVYRGMIFENSEYLFIGISTYTNFTDITVKGGILYFYMITAENSIGESLFSEAISILAFDESMTVPNSPSNLTAIESQNYVDLSWNTPENDGGSPITGYRVYRGIISGEYTLIFLTTATSYNDTFVTAGSAYYYAVTAENSLGESLYSEEVNITSEVTPEILLTVPSAPQALSASAGDNHVELSWTTPSNDGGSTITGYRVYRGTTIEIYTLIFIITITSYNDTLVLGNSSYYYVVTAINTVGESSFSNEVKATPTGISVPKSGSFPGFLAIFSFLFVLAIFTRKAKSR